MSTTYQRRWENRRTRDRRRGKETTYYGQPVIHHAHWRWSIILYFFLGGIAAASSVIATIARLFGGNDGKQIARTGTYVSFLSFIACPFLLIWDLGRPERFLNMLRVVKLRSPMSLGTWSIVIFGAFSTIGALVQAVDDGLLQRPRALARVIERVPMSAVGAANLLPGFFVGGYTGILLAITAVPLWTKRHLLMGPLFLASAMSAGASTLVLVMSRTRHFEALKKLERVERAVLISEAALLAIFLRSLGPTIVRPLREGTLGRIHRVGVLGFGIVMPLVLHAMSRLNENSSRMLILISSVFTLIGGFCLRLVMVLGGHASADDPEATFEMTAAKDGRAD